MPSQFTLTRDGTIYAPISGKNPGQSTLLEFAPHDEIPVNAINGVFEEPVCAALHAEAY
jgi:hypothetical protein